jgi:hypothetical protein
MNRIVRVLTLGAALTASVGVARADIITIDNNTVGTVYDGILDGIPPFPPPGEGPDGDGDSQGTALAVALKAGSVEERGIAEFPLTALAGLTAADIANATLTFNIDDVIGLFWPGANFDGTAADTFVIFAYSGNGTVDLTDFQNVAGAPAGLVDTTPLGVITDATLGVSGPLQFEVDITSRLQTLITGGATHIGLVFVTDDENSATSIDNLGAGGAGPPGVGGAIMPFLTIETVVEEPPVWDQAQLNCQKALGKGASKLAKTATKGLTKCLDGVLSATSMSEPLTTVTAKCTADLAPANPSSKVGKAIAKLTAGVADKCADFTPAAMGSPCDPGAITFTDVTTCVVAQTLASSGNAIGAAYGPACALITAVGLDGDYPAVCD